MHEDIVVEFFLSYLNQFHYKAGVIFSLKYYINDIDSLTAIEKGFPTIPFCFEFENRKVRGSVVSSKINQRTENRDLKLWVLFPAISGT